MTDEQEYPLVSAILLAGNSPLADINRVIQCFQRQTYPHKEMVLISDDKQQYDVLTSQYENDSDIRTVESGSEGTMGTDLNVAMRHARGDILAKFNVDCWYAPTRLSAQIATMASQTCHICLLSRILSYSSISGRARIETNNRGYIPDTMVWVCNDRVEFPSADYGVMTKVLEHMIERNMRPISMDQPQLCCRLMLSADHATTVNVDLDAEQYRVVLEDIFDTI